MAGGQARSEARRQPDRNREAGRGLRGGDHGGACKGQGVQAGGAEGRGERAGDEREGRLCVCTSGPPTKRSRCHRTWGGQKISWVRGGRAHTEEAEAAAAGVRGRVILPGEPGQRGGGARALRGSRAGRPGQAGLGAGDALGGRGRGAARATGDAGRPLQAARCPGRRPPHRTAGHTPRLRHSTARRKGPPAPPGPGTWRLRRVLGD